MRQNPAIFGLTPYDPKYLPADVLLSANENPLDVPEIVREEAQARIASTVFNRYPDPLANELRDLMCANLSQLLLPTLAPSSAGRKMLPSLDRSNILLGNGGDELIYNLFLAWGGQGSRVLTCSPSFSSYSIDAQISSTQIVDIPRKADFLIDEDAVLEELRSSKDISLVFLTSPNNPTGDLVSEDFMRQLLEASDALFVLDEAYGEYSERSLAHLLPEYPNLAILRTFSKAYALAGVRLGYLLSSAEVIDGLLVVRQPYSVDCVSQAIGCVVCSNLDAYSASVRSTIVRKKILLEKLRNITGLEAFDSSANFILIRTKRAGEVWQRMLGSSGVLVRDFSSSKGLENCLRLTVGTDSENEAMLDALVNAIMEVM